MKSDSEIHDVNRKFLPFPAASFLACLLLTLMVCLQLAIVILKALSKKFAMMQRGNACAKKVLGAPDATNARQDGLIILTANLANVQTKDQHREFAMPKQEIVPVILIMEAENVIHATVDFLATPNVTLVDAILWVPKAFHATMAAFVTVKRTLKA